MAFTSGMTLLDVQWCTEHLASLGAIAVPRDEYLAMAADAAGTRSPERVNLMLTATRFRPA